MSWPASLSQTARSGLRVERQRLQPLVAVRGAAGLAIVIGLMLWLSGPAVAASSAFGAFYAAIATFQRSWRPRPVLAFTAGVTLAVSTFLGYVAAVHLVVFMVLLAVWTFLAGLAWAAGPTFGIIASGNVSIMLVTITLPTSTADAARHAATIAFGGLVQATLAKLFPVRRWGAQRDALADALAAEADYARRLRHDPVAPFDPVPLMTARHAATLTPAQARRRPAALRGARGLAERIRPVLASLADPALGAPAEGPARDHVRELLSHAGRVLDAAARAVRHGKPAEVPDWPGAGGDTADGAGPSALTGAALRAETRLHALLHDIAEATGDPGHRPSPPARPHRAAADATASPVKAPAPAPATLARPTTLGVIPVALRAMRGELRAGSAVLRHAVRVTAVTVVGYLAASALPLGHPYWAPMTAVMIMRLDFTQTYARSVARFGGTLVGVAVASVVVQFAHPGTVVCAALAILCAGLMYTLLRTGYAVTSACVTGYTVFLLEMGGDDLTQTAAERVGLTLLGGLLAMASYALFPAWETPRLRDRLADWLAAGGRYAGAVLDHYADPRSTADVRQSLLDLRDARVAWQEAVETARHEPVRHRGLSRTATADAEDALAEFGRAAMLMEAHLPQRSATPAPAAAATADAVRAVTVSAAAAVRERRAPDWMPLRRALSAWDAADGDGRPDAEDPAEGAPAGESSSETTWHETRSHMVRLGVGLLLNALDELSDALRPTSVSSRVRPPDG
ncbi:FUSC family protein [Streptomyces sp. NPDC060194]|uniref:FUSC family protein n=1 Tax=Streptomyces sp. NPDC060194 TaxID=3347069 RepID=UPI003665F441